MHYGVLVIIDPPDTPNQLEGAVGEALEPYRDQHWDWWQIGGRWSGHFDGYDPATDPVNLKPCELCGGTGDRAGWRNEPREQQHESGCNGCLGKGQAVTWPTQWKTRPGDAIPVASLTPAHMEVFAVVCDYGWNGGEQYVPWAPDGDKFLKLPLPPLEWLRDQHAGKLAVIVDCHN